MNLKLSKTSYKLFILILLILQPLSIMVAVSFGTINISISDVYSAIITGPISPIQDPVHDVVWLIRLPRLILALAVGIGLSTCGTVMQAIVKNPLADPYILGISSGATLGATLGIILGIGTALGTNYIGFMAFLGALASSFIVLIISSIKGPSNSVKLILSGMATSAVFSSFSNLIIFLSNKKEAVTQIVNWSMGSLAGAKWDTNIAILIIIILGLIFFISQYRTLNLMLLGDDTAITLGTDLKNIRILYLIAISIMIGFCVYTCGMIGFVGLIIPHISRMIVGTDHKKLLPTSALLGSLFLIWADVLCRTIIPGTEMPIGILTSAIGAPIFIYMMVRKSYGFGGNN